MATYEEVTKAVIYLAALYPRQEIPEATYRAYFGVLKDLPADAVVAAAEKLGSESKWFPAAAELRQAAFDLLGGDNLPLPMECWQQIEDKWRGKYVEFHPLTRKALDAMGGFRVISQTKEEDTPFVRSQFIKVCETIRNREMEDRRELPTVTEYKQLQAGKPEDVQAAFKQLADKKRAEKQPKPPIELSDFFGDGEDD